MLTATFRLPGIFGLAAGDGAAWVTTGNAVLRIDPRTDRASQVLSDPGASLTGIAFGAGSLWVEDAMGILRVDPVTGKVTASIGVPAGSYVVLLAVSPGRAWLALTGTGSGARPAVTEVFGTRDGGRSWTRSAPIHAPGAARWLDFSDPVHGWLLQDLGAAMGNNSVQLYRTSDGGRD